VITDDQLKAMNPEMAAMWIVGSAASLSKPQYQALVIACRNGGYVEAGGVERVSAAALLALARRGYLARCYGTEGGLAGRLSERARTRLADVAPKGQVP
jgi:hypothetical protein